MKLQRLLGRLATEILETVDEVDVEEDSTEEIAVGPPQWLVEGNSRRPRSNLSVLVSMISSHAAAIGPQLWHPEHPA